MRALGPEPLGNAFDAAMLAQACAGKKTSLKAALLDQRIVAGLGNIYVCEALYRAQLSPKRKASTIATRAGAPNERAERLVDAIKAVLHDAIKAGGSSLRDHRRTDGELGMFQHNFRVYDREGEPCPTPGCTGTIRRIVQSGALDLLLSGVPEMSVSGERTERRESHMSYETILVETQGRVGADPAQSAAGAQCAQRRADGGTERRGATPSRPMPASAAS